MSTESVICLSGIRPERLSGITAPGYVLQAVHCRDESRAAELHANEVLHTM